MQPGIASENMSKDCYIQIFGMLVPKITAHWKVNNKKKTNASLEYIKYQNRHSGISRYYDISKLFSHIRNDQFISFVDIWIDYKYLIK